MDDNFNEVPALDILCGNSFKKGPVKKIATNRINRKNIEFFLS